MQPSFLHLLVYSHKNTIVYKGDTLCSLSHQHLPENICALNLMHVVKSLRIHYKACIESILFMTTESGSGSGSGSSIVVTPSPSPMQPPIFRKYYCMMLCPYVCVCEWWVPWWFNW